MRIRNLYPLAVIGCLLLTACGGAADQQNATQTPIILIVTGDTPDSGAEPIDPNASPLSEVFPTPFTCSAGIVEQAFEHGRMFWVGKTLDERCLETHQFKPESGEIWVALFDQSGNGGEWLIFTDDWQEEDEIPFDITATEPQGLIQPARGFGKVWREKLSADQREALGWATSQEFGFLSTYRYDAGGFVNDQGEYVPRPGQHSLISFVGERFFFDEQARRFDYVPAD